MTDRRQVLVAKKAYYEKHKARLLAQQKAKREADKASFYAHRRQLYVTNRAHKNELQRQRYEANREHRLANNRKYRAARLDEFRARDKHYAKAYQARHPDRVVETRRRATLTRRALKASVFVESVDALTVFRRDKGVCGICRQRVDPKSRWHVDHIVPLSQGGVHAYTNVQLAHARCNLSKQAKLQPGQIGLFQKAAR